MKTKDTKLTVLIADDDVGTLLPVRSYFERHQLSLIEVTHPAGLRAKAGRADALVVDCGLTNEVRDDGIATVAKLLQDGIIPSTVPIVFISNLSEQDQVFAQSLRNRVLKNRYVWLRKPFQNDYLVAVIKRERDKRKGA